jgi:hypothetical protein
MVTLYSALEDIMQLDFNSRETLLEILQKRQSEARRDEILKNAKKSIKDYEAGKLKPQSLEDIIDRLDSL